jgi:predicted nucleotide-binding protein (sugar kinase/HSP70/actin superfamily)
MSYGSARLFSAAFRSIGIDGEVTPPSDERTHELGEKYTCGDECYPTKVTLGDLLRILEQPENDPGRTLFFMPTAHGPCRFGQYASFFREVLDSLGFDKVEVLSPEAENGYAGLGEVKGVFVRTGWRALVAGDILLKMLLKTRPYEMEAGAADRAHEESLADLSAVIETPYLNDGLQLRAMVRAVERCRDRFRAVPARYHRALPLIGIVGEIFCRLNTYSNDDIVRRLEEYGAECWMSDIAEWIWYTNAEELRRLHLIGRSISLARLAAQIRHKFQRKDEHELWAPVVEDCRGYEEPHDMLEMLKSAEPYLPRWGAMGEMVVNAGRSIYLAQKGVDGVLDISPFTCMNGIVCEAIYPQISHDHYNIPIRNFYFDGTQSDLDRDIGIYLELARTYSSRKPYPRVYPAYFGNGTQMHADRKK